MLACSIVFMPVIISLVGRVSCGAPHLSNHPLQYSLHIRGVLGRIFFRGANSSSGLAQVPKLMVHRRSSSPLRWKLEDQSHWNRVTLSKPEERRMFLMELT